MKNAPPKFKNKLVFESDKRANPETEQKKKIFFYFSQQKLAKRKKKEKHASLDFLKKVVMINKFMIWNGLK